MPWTIKSEFNILARSQTEGIPDYSETIRGTLTDELPVLRNKYFMAKQVCFQI